MAADQAYAALTSTQRRQLLEHVVRSASELYAWMKPLRASHKAAVTTLRTRPSEDGEDASKPIMRRSTARMPDREKLRIRQEVVWPCPTDVREHLEEAASPWPIAGVNHLWIVRATMMTCEYFAGAKQLHKLKFIYTFTLAVADAHMFRPRPSELLNVLDDQGLIGERQPSGTNSRRERDLNRVKQEIMRARDLLKSLYPLRTELGPAGLGPSLLLDEVSN